VTLGIKIEQDEKNEIIFYGEFVLKKNVVFLK
jgi:hypothetical protein